MFKLFLEKAEEQEIQMPTVLDHWKGKKVLGNKQTNTYFCIIDSVKTFKYVDHYKLRKTLKEIEIPDNLTCLWRNLYAGQEATVRAGHGKTGSFQIERWGPQGCILSLLVCDLCAEYIMRNSGLEEAQAGVQISRRNINHFRYADDTTLTAENEEELFSLLKKMREESEKLGLKLNLLQQRSRHLVPSLHRK